MYFKIVILFPNKNILSQNNQPINEQKLFII